MMYRYTDRAGYQFTVSDCGFLDWGVSVYAPTGEILLDNPHILSSECYGEEDLSDPEVLKDLANEMIEECYMIYMIENMVELPAPSSFR